MFIALAIALFRPMGQTPTEEGDSTFSAHETYELKTSEMRAAIWNFEKFMGRQLPEPRRKGKQSPMRPWRGRV
jgi:hypothetical protein